MDGLILLIVFIFGAIIGSFLNVVLYRFHTGKSLNGRSHCMSCGKTLSWRELFPVFSYLFQRGRCVGCKAFIPPRYLVVELLTAFLYVLVWQTFAHTPFFLILYLALATLFVLIIVYDVRHTIIPDEFTLAVGILSLVHLVRMYLYTHDVRLVLGAVGAGIGASAFFAGLWYLTKGRGIGFGDAKLALPLGILAGVAGVFTMVVLSFWVGALVVLVYYIYQKLSRGKIGLRFLQTPITMKSEIPFAPFLITGFLLVALFHADVFTITYTIFFPSV